MFGLPLPASLQGWASIISIALNFLLAGFCWSLRQIAKEEFAKLIAPTKATVIDHDRRLIKAEGRILENRDSINQLPTKADMERVSGKLDGVCEEVKAAARGIDRIEDHFLRRGIESQS